MLRRTLLSSAPLLAMPGLSFSQVQDLSDAINKAGRLRMLSQRMAKCYFAMAQNVQRQQAQSVLNDSMARFDRQLIEVKAFAPTPALKTLYEKLYAGWVDYKLALVGAAASKAGGDKVIAASTAVMALTDQGAQQLEALSGKPIGHLVNVASRQCMLSQRMASAYMSASLGVQANEGIQILRTARGEYSKGHAEMVAAPQSSERVKQELRLAELQYKFFDASLTSLKAGSITGSAQTDVFTTSERILQVMDGVADLYARTSA
jgi:nitrate/nitrite-specific signal transduction histidine kinase